ncbi:hypothetical protein [Komagataeibacter europaeus]|uniref:hypothetical protein n=1 Tax=Komagataeibacter europaeus TaxID=33995 RepID=UPI002174DE6B|nr:hypothetical protein [Komagataeibacter europaeus]
MNDILVPHRVFSNKYRRQSQAKMLGYCDVTEDVALQLGKVSICQGNCPLPGSCGEYVAKALDPVKLMLLTFNGETCLAFTICQPHCGPGKHALAELLHQFTVTGRHVHLRSRLELTGKRDKGTKKSGSRACCHGRAIC